MNSQGKKESSRLFYLDNLRSTALVLGLVFHAAIVYGDTIGYAIKSSKRHIAYDLFCYWIHCFRMPLFFFLSGYFSKLILEKKGIESFLDSRLKRILVPSLVGIIALAPIQYYIEFLNANNYIPFLEYYPKFFFTQGEFALSHIWFLVYLFFYSLLIILARKLGLKGDAPNSKLLYILFPLLTIHFLLFVNGKFHRGFAIYGIDVFLFFFYFSFYLAGIFSFSLPDLWRTDQNFPADFKSNWSANSESNINAETRTLFPFLLLFLLAVLSYLGLYYFETIDPLWMYYGGQRWILRVFHFGFLSISAWTWIFFLIRLFKLSLNFENSFTLYMKDSSLAIYLIHHPISLILGFTLERYALGVHTSFLIQCLGTIVLSYTIYEVLVRKSRLLQFLLGTIHP